MTDLIYREDAIDAAVGHVDADTAVKIIRDMIALPSVDLFEVVVPQTTLWTSGEIAPTDNGFYLAAIKARHSGGVAMDEGMGIYQFYDGRWSVPDAFYVEYWLAIPPLPEASHGDPQD